MIRIENNGPLILATNYWETELAQNGRIFCSINAGTIRVLLPDSFQTVIPELRAAQYAILSRGPWSEQGLDEAVEILWEDHSSSPHAWHLSLTSFDMLPAEPPKGREWQISLWVFRGGKPEQILERLCRWRRVEQIPCLQPWSS